jgi:hypothetical protein
LRSAPTSPRLPVCPLRLDRGEQMEKPLRTLRRHIQPVRRRFRPCQPVNDASVLDHRAGVVRDGLHRFDEGSHRSCGLPVGCQFRQPSLTLLVLFSQPLQFGAPLALASNCCRSRSRSSAQSFRMTAPSMKRSMMAGSCVSRGLLSVSSHSSL